jgi:tRNA(Ile)-lysidine synthase
MDPAVAEVRVAVRTALQELPSGAQVLAAVSGGADSMALAAALAAEAPRVGQHAGAVTIDHGLQTGSVLRSQEVADRCRDLGLDPVVVEAVTVGAAGGPEAAARDAHYAALEDVAARTGATAVALGHTLDDQAETVLLGLARGSGARSLAGMPARRGNLIRPLLAVRRDTTAKACAALGITPWSDPHNEDPAYTRARVRATAMPALMDALGPGVPEALARTAAMLRSDTDALDAWAEQVIDPLDVAVLKPLPAAVRTRVLRRAAIAAGASAGSLTAAHVGNIDALVMNWRGQGPVSLPGGLVAHRAYGRLSFR